MTVTTRSLPLTITCTGDAERCSLQARPPRGSPCQSQPGLSFLLVQGFASLWQLMSAGGCWLPSNGRGGQRAERLRKIEMKQEFQFGANGWSSEASISRNYHCINVFQAAFFTVECGVIFLVIHSLTSGYNQSCLRALLSETYYYVLEEKILGNGAVPESYCMF